MLGRSKFLSRTQGPFKKLTMNDYKECLSEYSKYKKSMYTSSSLTTMELNEKTISKHFF